VSLGLTVLGGAAAWPNPEQGCSSYLVDDGQTTLLLDCGPDTMSTLRAETDYHDIDAIILSHWHSDHVLDIVPYRYGLVYGPGSLPRPIPLYVPPGISRRLDELAAALIDADDDPRAFWEGVFRIHEYGSSSDINVGSFSIRFVETQHYVPCFAARVTHRDTRRVIVYSADAGVVEPLIDLFRGADIAIVEATLDDHGETPRQDRGHLTPEDAGRLARMASVGTLVVTHLWSERDSATVVARASTQFHGPVIAASAGMRINV